MALHEIPDWLALGHPVADQVLDQIETIWHDTLADGDAAEKVLRGEHHHSAPSGDAGAVELLEAPDGHQHSHAEGARRWPGT